MYHCSHLFSVVTLFDKHVAKQAQGCQADALKDQGCHICQQETNVGIVKMEWNTANQRARVTFSFSLKTAVGFRLGLAMRQLSTDCNIFIPLAVSRLCKSLCESYSPRRGPAGWFLPHQPGRLAETSKVYFTVNSRKSLI